jgi:hypothetical protein
MIINEFQTEKELFDAYPKKFYWNLKDDVFIPYWEEFLEFADNNNLTIRHVVHKESIK